MKYQNKSFSVPISGQGEWPCAHKRRRIDYPFGNNRYGTHHTAEGVFVIRSHTVCAKCGVITHTEYEKVQL